MGRPSLDILRPLVSGHYSARDGGRSAAVSANRVHGLVPRNNVDSTTSASQDDAVRSRPCHRPVPGKTSRESLPIRRRNAGGVALWVGLIYAHDSRKKRTQFACMMSSMSPGL